MATAMDNTRVEERNSTEQCWCVCTLLWVTLSTEHCLQSLSSLRLDSGYTQQEALLGCYQVIRLSEVSSQRNWILLSSLHEPATFDISR